MTFFNSFFKKKKKNTGFNSEKMGKGKMLNPVDRAALYQTVSLLYANGITPYEAVKLKHDLLSERDKPPKAIIKAMWLIQKRIRSGQSFSRSLLFIVPDSERNLIIASEKGDNIDIGSSQATKLARSESNIRKNIRKAVAYPIGILTGLIAMLAFFGYSLFPIFADITPVETWSTGAQRIFALSSNIEIWLPIFIVALYVLSTVIKRSLSSWIGALRFSLDSAILYKTYRYYTGGIFLVTLSGLMQSGVDFKASLDIIADQTQSKWLKYYVRRIITDVRAGKRPGAAMSKKIFSDEVLDEIVVYDRASPEKFSEILGDIGARAIAEGDETIQKITSLVNVLGLATAGGLIGYVFMTIFSLVQNINKTM